MNKIFAAISKIGISKELKPDEILQRHCLVYQAVLMSLGGMFWGVLAMCFNLKLQAGIPFGYAFLSILNLGYFNSSQNFGFVKFFQSVISLLLPFLFQLSLGGFVSSGGVMLWALLSLAVSVTYQSTKATVWWLLIYLLLTILSGVFDKTFQEWTTASIADNSILFFVVNITIISTIVLWLVNFMYREKDNAMHQLQQTQMQLLQSEKMAAFGVMASRVAHEIQNPLNFVNNFSELSQELIEEIVSAKNEEEKNDAAKVLFENLQKINLHGKRASNIISTLQEHSNKGTAHKFFENEN